MVLLYAVLIPGFFKAAARNDAARCKPLISEADYCQGKIINYFP